MTAVKGNANGVARPEHRTTSVGAPAVLKSHGRWHALGLVIRVLTCLVAAAPRPAAAQFFDPAFDATAAVTEEVRTVAIQSDGKILAGGSNGLVRRLLPNGSPDPSFTAPSFRGANINSIAIQPSGQVLVGGTILSGRESLVRLTANDAIDSAFRPLRLIGEVEKIVVQPDGRILVGVARLLP
jgi:hypothetical protein